MMLPWSLRHRERPESKITMASPGAFADGDVFQVAGLDGKASKPFVATGAQGSEVRIAQLTWWRRIWLKLGVLWR